MNIQNLLNEKEKQRRHIDYLTFSEDELQTIRADELQHIIDFFHGYTLMRLPQFEIDFFEWLKLNDRPVWDDLWGDDENTYLVSIDLLSQMVGNRPQFPICELIDEPNYWFTQRHIKPKGVEALQEIILKYQNGKALDPGELFMIEISQGPTDIWHFCHQYHIDLREMKKYIADLVYNGWLVHLTNRDDLVKYIDI